MTRKEIEDITDRYLLLFGIEYLAGIIAVILYFLFGLD